MPKKAVLRSIIIFIHQVNQHQAFMDQNNHRDDDRSKATTQPLRRNHQGTQATKEVKGLQTRLLGPPSGRPFGANWENRGTTMRRP